jgi:cytoplasmic iron level regulating protein YaaA (DUF328/UPF0246 family)
MLFLLSPAKTLDYENAALTDDFTTPRMLDHSAELVEGARNLSAADVKALMGVSDNIAELNVERFAAWSQPFSLQNSKQAVYAFKGDVYTGLNVETMSGTQVEYLQNQVRILSGLYGLLRPLDLMQAYRLEMGIKFQNDRGPNLYKFWGAEISNLLNEDLSDSESLVINLASNEYFKAVDKKVLNARIITPVFKDLKNGAYKIVSFYAKKARGLMVRYAADNNITDAELLKGFDYEGYKFNAELSEGDTWVFTRDEPPKAK